MDISSLTVKELRFRFKRLGLKTTGNKAELKNRLSTAWQDGDEDDENDKNDAQEVHESEHSRAPLTQNGADDVQQNLNGGKRCGGGAIWEKPTSR